MGVFVGPDYELADRQISRQSTINLVLQQVETEEKARFTLRSVEGQVLFAALGAECRGSLVAAGRGFVVAGDSLFEVFSNGTSTHRGYLASSTGAVGMDYGLTQLVITDGPNLYVFTLSTNTFANPTPAGWLGSKTVRFLANYFVFVRPDSGVYYISAINDATDINALDFASAEALPDKLVAAIPDNEYLRLIGEISIETAGLTTSEFPFQKAQGASLNVGAVATFSCINIDGTVFFLGRDRNGAGVVMRMNGYQPQRISTLAQEQLLKTSTDLTAATAWSYQDEGLTYYCLNAPGLDCTLVYEVSTGTWHKRCELDAEGLWAPSRITCHMYVFGKHLVGDSDGKVSELRTDAYTIMGRPLVRERVSPHSVSPGRFWQFFKAFYADLLTGEAAQGDDPQVELSYSNDGGATWSDPRLRSIGKVGERFARVVWRALGRARDRVWKLRFSGNAPFAIHDVDVEKEAGIS